MKAINTVLHQSINLSTVIHILLLAVLIEHLVEYKLFILVVARLGVVLENSERKYK